MKDMRPVTQQELQRMGAGGQLDYGLRLPPAKADMVVVRRERFVQRWQVGIDQQVMMPRVVF